jgi:imidazolonepropionase
LGAIFVRGARQLLTLRGAGGVRRGAALADLGVVEDGSLLIRDGLITQVGSTRRLENLKEARSAGEIAVNGLVVMPGFVDPSIQLSPALVAATGRRQSAAAFHDSSFALLRASMQYGTLHAQCRIGAQNADVRTNLSALRQIATVGNRLGGITRCWRIDRNCAPEELPAALATVVHRKLAHRIEITAGYGQEQRDVLWAAAQREGLGTNLLWGSVAGDLSHALLAAQPRAVICDGFLTNQECELLANCPAPVVFAPNCCLVHDVYAGTLVRAAKHGVAIALATGYEQTDLPVFNMQMAISLAVLRLGLSPEQAIAAATVNAAHAAGIGHATGTLEAGKRADLLVLDLPDYRELPRRFGSNHVLLAIRDGKLVINRTGRKVMLS